MPALFVSEDAFALPSYWDRRYEGAGPGEQVEEWYRGDRDEAMRAVVAAHLDPALPVLQLGVGTSRLQEAMAQGFREDEEQFEGDSNDDDDCFASVLSVDFSAVAIERQNRRHDALLLLAASGNTRKWAARLSYARADVRRMPELADGSFGGGVLDKGALDALLCGDDADEAAADCLGEVWRVLAPGAAYVMITSAEPAARRRMLPTAEGEAVAEAAVAAEAAEGEGEGGAAAADVDVDDDAPSSSPRASLPRLPVWAGVLVYRLGQQGALAGPAALGDAGAEAALLAAHEGDSRFQYSHYAYVCVKG